MPRISIPGAVDMRQVCPKCNGNEQVLDPATNTMVDCDLCGGSGTVSPTIAGSFTANQN